MRIGKWTVTDVVQGKPIGHPSHALFVHFPSALYPMALVFDILSRVRSSEGHANTATILLGVAVAGGVAASVTGFVDWWGMVRGSTKRRYATKHMLVQMAAQVFVAGALGVHLASVGPAPVAAVVLGAAATAALIVGNWMGGHLVYRMAMRVGGRPEPSPPTARELARRG